MLVLLARKHWRNKRCLREERERTFLKGIKHCQVTGVDVPLQTFLDDANYANPFNVH